MNSYERVMTTLSHRETDRVPVFLFLTVHGAKELSLELKEYFSKAEYIVEGQLRMVKRYGHDCVYPFFYGAKEFEAFGGDVVFYRDGPPNTGKPLIQDNNDIDMLKVPRSEESLVLREPLKAIELLAGKVKGQIPIISAVIAPFSLPAMLMGFERWLNLLLFGEEELREKLLRLTRDFCVSWANAQLDAGADAIGFFDPLATSDMLTREQFLRFDFELARETISKIKGPVAYAGAGGRFQHIIDLLPKTGAAAVVISSKDDLGSVKRNVGEKINIFGNLNNIEMVDWTPEKAEEEVKRCIEQGAKGGGYIVADQHGELPYYVEDRVLKRIVDAVGRFGHE